MAQIEAAHTESSRVDTGVVAYGIYVATSGAVARQRELEVHANNLANVGTDGFKAAEVTFEEVMRSAGAPDRHLVQTGAQRLDMRSGHLEPTGDPHDWAVVGDGFFAVEGPNQEPLLRRTLTVRVSEEGDLIDVLGQRVLTEGTRGGLDPRSRVDVAADGRIRQNGEIVGRAQTFQVPEPAYLKPVGGQLFRPTEASGVPFEQDTEVQSGIREASNVQSVSSMVGLIQVERGFQTLVRAIEAYRDADESVIQQTTQS